MRDKRIPLELCPSSNVQTGAAASIAEHPIGLLRDLRFRVTVNTDNRLMSGTSMSREMALLVEAFGYGWADLQWFTINAMKSAFIPFDERLVLINEVIKPAYAKLLGRDLPGDVDHAVVCRCVLLWSAQRFRRHGIGTGLSLSSPRSGSARGSAWAFSLPRAVMESRGPASARRVGTVARCRRSGSRYERAVT